MTDIVRDILERFEKIASRYETNGVQCSLCDSCERTYPKDWVDTCDGLCPFCGELHTFESWYEVSIQLDYEASMHLDDETSTLGGGAFNTLEEAIKVRRELITSKREVLTRSSVLVTLTEQNSFIDYWEKDKEGFSHSIREYVLDSKDRIIGVK